MIRNPDIHRQYVKRRPPLPTMQAAAPTPMTGPVQNALTWRELSLTGLAFAGGAAVPLTTEAVPNCNLVMIQYSKIGSYPMFGPPAWNSPYYPVHVRDGNLQNLAAAGGTSVAAALTSLGLELFIGQVCTIEADPGAYLDPRGIWVVSWATVRLKIAFGRDLAT